MGSVPGSPREGGVCGKAGECGAKAIFLLRAGGEGGSARPRRTSIVAAPTAAPAAAAISMRWGCTRYTGQEEVKRLGGVKRPKGNCQNGSCLKVFSERPGRAPPALGMSEERSIHPPTIEDLYGLLKLCGSESGVVDYFSRWYQLPKDTIQPTILGWLAALPAVPPPSRMRSAPAMSGPRTAAAAPALTLRKPTAAVRGPDILPIKTPPASAPVHQSAQIVAAMRSVDARLSAPPL